MFSIGGGSTGGQWGQLPRTLAATGAYRIQL